MRDSLEEIMFILAPDIRYIEKECKYLSDQEREELSGKIDKALDLLIECSDFIDKKRKENENGMENKKVFSKTFGMRAYEVFISYLYENGKKYREEENEVSIIVYYED